MLTIHPPTAFMSVGETLQLQARGQRGNVRWSSSSTVICEVCKNGLVKAKAGGVATITARSSSLEATAIIIVQTIVAEEPQEQSPIPQLKGIGNGIKGTPVAFDTTGTQDPDGSIVQSVFDPDDGTTPVTVAGPPAANFQHTFALVGTYDTTLTVTDNSGRVGAVTLQVVIINPPAPVNVALPPVSGIAQNGETLTAQSGVWTGLAPITYAYQWTRCNSGGTSCSPVVGQVASTYVLSAADIGSTLRVIVTATNPGGSTSATSVQTGVVIAIPAPPPPATAPSNTTLPTISGNAQQAQTLTGVVGGWDGTATITYTREWLRCAADGSTCAVILGQTGSTYLLALADVGSTIRFRVTATNSAGSAQATSVQTAVIATYDPPPPPPPPVQTSPIAKMTIVSGLIAGSPVVISTAGSSAPSGELASGLVNWQDGPNTTWTTPLPATASHTYATAGARTITLSLTDNNGLTGTVSVDVVIAAAPVVNLPPVAALVKTSGALVGDTCVFSTLGTFDPEGSLASGSLDFNDGTVPVSWTGAPSTSYNHAYTTGGLKSATLLVIDSVGNATPITITFLIIQPSTTTGVITPDAFSFDGYYRIPGYFPYECLTTERVVAGERRVFVLTKVDMGDLALNDFYLMEFRIPVEAPSVTISSAPYLELVANHGRIFRDHINSDSNSGNDPFNPGAIKWDEARGGVWWTYSGSYIPLPNSPSLGFTRITGGVISKGPWRITDFPFFTTGTMCDIPSAYAAANLSGQTMMFAGGVGSGVAQAPMGTSMLLSAMFDPMTTPAHLVGGTTILGNPRFLLYHDVNHRQSRDVLYNQCGWLVPNGTPLQCGTLNTSPVPLWAGNDPANNSSENASRGFWYDDGSKRGVIFIGTLVRFPLGTAGVAHQWYGTAGPDPSQNDSCCHNRYDPYWPGTTGPGAEFRNPTMWIYDPQAMLPIISGAANGWDILPTTDADRWGERFPTAFPIHVPTDPFVKSGVPGANSIGMGIHVDYATRKLRMPFRIDATQGFGALEMYAIQQFSIRP